MTFFPPDYHALAEINPEPGASSFMCDLQCDPGRRRSGTIVDAAGQPVTGAWLQGISPQELPRHTPLESNRFDVIGLDPRQPRRVYAFHNARGLAGSVVADGNEAGPLVIRLEPQAVVTGRVVDEEEGNPIGGLDLMHFYQRKFDPARGTLAGNLVVGSDGRFRVVLVPGLTYEAKAVSRWKNQVLGQVFQGLKLAPGETKNLGDVTLKKPQTP
jgi:hypothetical protein